MIKLNLPTSISFFIGPKYKKTYFFDSWVSDDESKADGFACFSTTSLSFIPNLHSGIPDRKLFMTTLPDTCALRTWPKITQMVKNYWIN